MHKCSPNYSRHWRALITSQIVAFALVAPGCSGRKVDSDAAPEKTHDLRLEDLTSALSRAQSRLEEMDARLSALSDKVESTRLTVDNIAGARPLKTEVVGTAKKQADSDAEDLADSGGSHEAQLAEGKQVLRMDSAISDFTKAMHLFKAGKYTDAELAFNHFTERYPEHILAGSAQFFAGESYFMMGEYKLAINEYGKVISSFNGSPRVASAMVRLAHCYQAAGNTGEATRTLALARDLYEGNPSLDWSSPLTEKRRTGEKRTELPGEIIEPASTAKAHSEHKEVNAHTSDVKEKD